MRLGLQPKLKLLKMLSVFPVKHRFIKYIKSVGKRSFVGVISFVNYSENEVTRFVGLTPAYSESEYSPLCIHHCKIWRKSDNVCLH